MRPLVLFVVSFFFSVSTFAQPQFPKLPVNIDSLFGLLKDRKVSDSVRVSVVRQVDEVADPFTTGYPLFRGMVNMYQAFYLRKGTLRTEYLQKGVRLIASNKRLLADSFSAQLYQLLDFYDYNNRMDEWKPVDSILRSVVSVQKNDFEACVMAYAAKKLEQKAYNIAENLAKYDRLFSEENFPDQFDYKLARTYDSWLVLRSRYEFWLTIPYYQRNPAYTLKNDYRTVFSELDALYDSAVTKNDYKSAGYVAYRRMLYFRTYKEAALSYASWSILDHREGQAILPLKTFLLEKVIDKDIPAAAAANVKPILSCNEIADMFSTLCDLYINVTDGRSAYLIAEKAQKTVDAFKSCNDQQYFSAVVMFTYQKVRAARLQARYIDATAWNDLLKRWYPLPTTADSASLPYWNWYIDVRLQEYYTLLAQGNSRAAADTMQQLMTSIAPLDSADLLPALLQWTHLQFAGMKLIAEKGKWDIVRDYSLEALRILEQDNHWENVPYYYDLQLLYFTAKYHSEKLVLKNALNNMLFYTGRHLQHTFFMLAPDDRIRLYEQKLRPYFDVYHELLVNKLVDGDTAIKKQIIDQSLFLKNALVDDNLLPTEILAGSSRMSEFVEEVRKNRRRTNLIVSRLRMRKQSALNVNSSDLSQSLWLRILESANLDSIASFTGWRKIAGGLQRGQVYVEMIRYNSWLTDSSARYAAYVITSGEMQLLPMFPEKKILSLLNDPLASPQSGSLNGTNRRGISLQPPKDAPKKFIKGSEDKLGTLILAPLEKYISGNKELLLVPDGLLNRISLAALQYRKKSLFQSVRLRQLSGSYVLFQAAPVFPQKARALLAGSFDYGESKSATNINRLLNKKYSWQYLPATAKEIASLKTVFDVAGDSVTVLKDRQLADSLIDTLSAFRFIHLATHGFYVDSSNARDFYDPIWDMPAIQQEPMMRCGIAVSDANDPSPDGVTSDGHLLGFELANTDLRKSYLISLSACETGLGDLRNNLGVDGLPRALKLGGARYLLISLWKVPDAPTAVFMEHFYKALFRLKNPAAALRDTQQYMSQRYDVPDWAAFVLVE